ncbi:hypothetical protein SSPO_001580 [Streptomyces antimycoticus]|uniref:Uncharacterized protein n=1 Tax=Streptomyces antimycoticus TaxID=68175 RepID=A0A499UCN5_9ACTN|nr:hypothetical protein SSPO_001580 [Streptomyces antimycoticus]
MCSVGERAHDQGALAHAGVTVRDDRRGRGRHELEQLTCRVTPVKMHCAPVLGSDLVAHRRKRPFVEVAECPHPCRWRRVAESRTWCASRRRRLRSTVAAFGGYSSARATSRSSNRVAP